MVLSDRVERLDGVNNPKVLAAYEYYPFGMHMVIGIGDKARYSINNQEKVDELGEGHTTAKFWEYDARLGRRWNLDPKPILGTSEYSVFKNNPIGYKDVMGDKPTPKEAAKLANDVYKTEDGKYKEDEQKTDKKELDGWELSDKKFEGVTLTDDKSGFNSALYQRQTGTDKKGNATYEYAYVTQGTDPTSKEDWDNNFQQGLGNYSKQYDISISNARALDKQMGDAELAFSGHSLGGGMASANANATGRDAYTYNAAGLHDKTISRHQLYRPSVIKAFVIDGEVVSVTQGLMGLKAEGEITVLPASYLPLIPFAPTQINVGIGAVNSVKSIMNHLMGPVLEKMDEQGIK